MYALVGAQRDWLTQEGSPYTATRAGNAIRFQLEDGRDWEIVRHATLIAVTREAVAMQGRDVDPRPGGFVRLTRSASYILPIFRAAEA